MLLCKTNGMCQKQNLLYKFQFFVWERYWKQMRHKKCLTRPTSLTNERKLIKEITIDWSKQFREKQISTTKYTTVIKFLYELPSGNSYSFWHLMPCEKKMKTRSLVRFSKQMNIIILYFRSKVHLITIPLLMNCNKIK